MKFKVALCGLTARDARLIEIVLSRAPNAKYQFELNRSAEGDPPAIVVVDESSMASVEGELARYRQSNPNLVMVYITDSVFEHRQPYRIERKSLLLHIGRILDSVVELELSGRPALPKKAAAAGQGTQGAATGAKLHALIVDDSAAVRAQLKSALDRAGILSDQADSAETARERLAERRYDLVFLDVVMPGADGYELCRVLKKDTYMRATPVVMLTSKSSPFDRARGALAGCDSYLVKPTSWDTFYSAVDKVLSKKYRNDRDALAARGYLLSPVNSGPITT